MQQANRSGHAERVAGVKSRDFGEHSRCGAFCCAVPARKRRSRPSYSRCPRMAFRKVALARAVGADDGGHFAAVDVKIHVLQNAVGCRFSRTYSLPAGSRNGRRNRRDVIDSSQCLLDGVDVAVHGFKVAVTGHGHVQRINSRAGFPGNDRRRRRCCRSALQRWREADAPGPGGSARFSSFAEASLPDSSSTAARIFRSKAWAK